MSGTNKKPAKVLTVDDHIKAAIKSATTSRALIQTAAVETLRHAEKHGDYSKADALVNGLPASVRKDSLVAWFGKFGGLSISDNGFMGWKGAEYVRENFQAAKDTPWDSVKKAPDPWKGFDLKAELSRVLAKANTEMKKHAGDVDLRVDPDMLAALAALTGATRPNVDTPALEGSPRV